MRHRGIAEALRVARPSLSWTCCVVDRLLPSDRILLIASHPFSPEQMSAQTKALDELTQSDMFRKTKELVTCPESDSFVCEVCKWMIPGVGLSTIALLVFLLTWPHGEWPVFVRFFEGWTDIFRFRLLIDQSKFTGTKRYLIAAVPHGVVPLGSIITGAYVRQVGGVLWWW